MMNRDLCTTVTSSKLLGSIVISCLVHLALLWVGINQLNPINPSSSTMRFHSNEQLTRSFEVVELSSSSASLRPYPKKLVQIKPVQFSEIKVADAIVAAGSQNAINNRPYAASQREAEQSSVAENYSKSEHSSPDTTEQLLLKAHKNDLFVVRPSFLGRPSWRSQSGHAPSKSTGSESTLVPINQNQIMALAYFQAAALERLQGWLGRKVGHMLEDHTLQPEESLNNEFVCTLELFIYASHRVVNCNPAEAVNHLSNLWPELAALDSYRLLKSEPIRQIHIPETDALSSSKQPEALEDRVCFKVALSLRSGQAIQAYAKPLPCTHAL